MTRTRNMDNSNFVTPGYSGQRRTVIPYFATPSMRRHGMSPTRARSKHSHLSLVPSAEACHHMRSLLIAPCARKRTCAEGLHALKAFKFTTVRLHKDVLRADVEQTCARTQETAHERLMFSNALQARLNAGDELGCLVQRQRGQTTVRNNERKQ